MKRPDAFSFLLWHIGQDTQNGVEITPDAWSTLIYVPNARTARESENIHSAPQLFSFRHPTRTKTILGTPPPKEHATTEENLTGRAANRPMDGFCFYTNS